ncbi:unnamed protein product [Mesocestoides corti]|uniref:Serine incorporator n=1 Tax=Mesocestoides corti TaxID=53468 RepID=A0A0R3UEE8_MESCO|nr:unnamed protein product [Mesocestoides corti]
MGCLLSCVACCFCDAAASLCCKCLPSCKSSTSTRLVYGLLLLSVIILSSVALSPEVGKLLKRIPSLCPGEPNNICQLITGYGAVYRMCFALSLFFFVFSLIMIEVRSSRDFRSAIHNGFWFFKILAIIGIMVGAFFIHDPLFLSVWMIFGMIGACLYILLQLVLLVDFAHTWNEKWVGAYNESGNRSYVCALISSTVFFYSLSIAAVVLFYIYFASAPCCRLGKMLVSINLILCVILSVISILPVVQDKLPSSGLLQSSVISAYIMFLTWSALVNVPEVACNPTLRTTNKTIIVDGKEVTAVSLVILMISVVYASIRTSSHNTGGMDTSNAETSPSTETAERGQLVWDNEKEGVAYSYAMFHFMMSLATLFVMMSITDWYRPDSQTSMLSANYGSFWVKGASSWVCVAIYIWTLVAPVMFPDRDFS